MKLMKDDQRQQLHIRTAYPMSALPGITRATASSLTTPTRSRKTFRSESLHPGFTPAASSQINSPSISLAASRNAAASSGA